MAITYSITPQLRVKLKEPFGLLVKGSFDETMAKMKEIVENEKPPKIISVGDTVSMNLHEYAICAQVTIIDNQCMRKKVQPTNYNSTAVYVKNPQGTITQEAVEAVKEALKSNEHTQTAKSTFFIITSLCFQNIQGHNNIEHPCQCQQ